MTDESIQKLDLSKVSICQIEVYNPQGQNLKTTNMLSFYSLLLATLLMVDCQASYLFLSLGAQLYIPSQHYSLLTINYSIAKIQNKLFDIGIELSLNQTTEFNQVNTIFDFLGCDTKQQEQFVSCYEQDYTFINNRYSKYEPCYEICLINQNNFHNVDLHMMISNLSLILTQNKTEGQASYIIDNTFYPCKNGAYQPELYLEEFLNVSIQENDAYGLYIKITFLILFQVMIVTAGYLVIMFSRYRKLKKQLQYMKGQQEAQDLLNSFLNGGNGANGSAGK